jgi:enoyl-CoA hydratase
VAGPDRRADQGRGLPAAGHRHPLRRVRRHRGPEEGHHRRSRRIDETLKKYRADAGKAPLASIEQDLNRLFVGDSVEQIFEFLEMDSSDWGKAQLAILKTKSPQTLKVAFRQLELGEAAEDFAEQHGDGVPDRLARRAPSRLYRRRPRRDRRQGQCPPMVPATLEGVTEAMLDEIFAALPADRNGRR